MKITYYCETCEKKFFDEGIPNINRRHFCGTFAKIHHLEQQEGEEIEASED